VTVDYEALASYASLSLSEISLKQGFIPVINERGVSPHFKNNDHPLWKAGSPSPIVIPASIDMENHWGEFTIHTEVDRRLRALKIGALAHGGTALTFVRPQAYISPLTANSSDADSTRATFLITFDLAGAEVAPRGGRFPVTLVFSLEDKVIPSWTIVAELELYAVGYALPRYLFNDGIPHTLLRFIIPPPDSIKDARDYRNWATQRVFLDTKHVYDTKGGCSRYAFGASKPFNLTLWCRNYDVMMAPGPEAVRRRVLWGYGEHGPTVNCIDQAGLLAICIALGFADESEYTKLRCCWMGPFGFITPTVLVGYLTECNSPFWGADRAKMLLDPMDAHRSYFRNHIFISYDEKIFDACSGPWGKPHAGTETIEQYKKNAIDPQHRKSEMAHNFSDPPKLFEYKMNREHIGVPGELLSEQLADLERINKIELELKGWHRDDDTQVAILDIVAHLTKIIRAKGTEWKMEGFQGSESPTVESGRSVEPAEVNIEWDWICTYDGVESGIHVLWRTFSGRDAALDAFVGTMTTASRADAFEFLAEAVPTGSIAAICKGEGQTTTSKLLLLHGRHTILFASRMADEGLVILSREIDAWMTANETTKVTAEGPMVRVDDAVSSPRTGKVGQEMSLPITVRAILQSKSPG
jgi:hypothetical protein